jgi:hypothetical protein
MWVYKSEYPWRSPKKLKCRFCGDIAYGENEAHRKGWDWFTRYLPETVYFCKNCADAYWKDIFDLELLSTKKPSKHI